MTTLTKTWNEGYEVAASLEADALPRRLVNTHVIARILNTFPRAAARFFARSRGELARLLFVEGEGGSNRVLRECYRALEPEHRGDWINRLLAQTPAIKAARNRRKIAQWMLGACLDALPPEKPKLVMAIGGGDGSLEAEVIAQFAERNVYYCGVDKDERVGPENERVLQETGLVGRGFTHPGTIARQSDVEEVLDEANRRFGVEFDGLSVTVCQGIAEYLDIGSETNETLGGMLAAVHACTRTEGGLVISQTDFHDRIPFLENGLSLYMRLRDTDEIARVIEEAGWRLAVCEHEPMRLITMCLAAKTDVRHWRLSEENFLKRPHQSRRRSPAASRRIAS